jgi:hypothetical protein
MVVDYMKVNDITEKDHYTMANAETELNKLKGKKVFTKFDIRAGYNNILIEEGDQFKAAFKTQVGTYIPQVMPFGLCNAPPLFQRATNQDFRAIKQNYPNKFTHFMDDMCVGTGDSPEELAKHRQIVHKLLELFKQHSYFLKLSKCVFEAREIEFLGFKIGYGVARIDQSKMDGLREWPRTLSTVKEVRQVLDVLGYQRPFIKDFAALTRPLTALTKKNASFIWTRECRNTLDTLITHVTNDPKLVAPDLEKQYEMETDASNFALGAILFQKDEQGKRQAVGFASCTLTATERNYDIWDKEFMRLIFGLNKWRHYLMCTKEPVLAYVDHANLAYYCHPQKINQRVARYIGMLADYNVKIIHKLGVNNSADALLHQPDYGNGKGDNENITALPDHLFINHMDSLTLYEKVSTVQGNDASTVQSWAKTNNLESNNHHWFKNRCLVVVENNELRRGIMHTYYNTPTAGHAGVATTLFSISCNYWWPNMKHFVTAYVKGCATCQANKANTRPNKPPLFPITPEHNALPFQTIMVDWITKLPESQGYDLVMTMTDHDCSKAMVFIPCKETDGIERMVELYTQHIVPHYGIPTKIISDHDSRLTAKLFKELCNVFGVRRNMSMAYHPQTDGQSERTNQTLEMFLQIFCNHQQNDWAKLLPVAQYALNAR